MVKKFFLSTVVTVATLSVGTIAQAGTIVQPTAISTSMGNFSASFDIGNIIDQSGLSQTYTSGVDDFDTYIGLNPTDSGGANERWVGTSQTGTITFDLGQSLNTTRLALWNSTFSISSVTAFEVYADDDGDFGNGGITLLGNFNPLFDGDPANPQVFDFTDSVTQFIHFNITANGGFSGASLSEVAFEGGVATTPEPTSLIGLVAISGGLLLTKRIKG
ncbi:MAG: PEP-CTERM sorting domain-containing protein [Crocosphaera sp.]